MTVTWRIVIVKRTGLKYIRLHDARHTHASLILKQGVRPKIVQERLGHSSIQITLDTYSHVAPGLQEAAAARFDEVFATTPKNGLSKILVSYPLAILEKSVCGKSYLMDISFKKWWAIVDSSRTRV